MVTKNGFSIHDPHSGILPSQLRRPHPTFDRFTLDQKIQAQKFAVTYMRFLNPIKTPMDATTKSVELAEKAKFPQGKDFLVVHPDGRAFAMVKYGSAPLEEGIRIGYAHTDSPCLKLRPNATFLEWDPDLQPLNTGVELLASGYGGINPHQWVGRNLEVKGWFHRKGNKIKVNFPVHSAEICVHTDKRIERKDTFEEAHSEDSLRLTTGYPTVSSFLKSLSFRGKEDFASSALYVFSTDKPSQIGPFFLGAYGHDDRSCLYALTRAFLESKPTQTALIFGFDREEVGSKGPGGAASKFFEQVLHETILREGKIKKAVQISEAYITNILSRSLAINADTDVAPTPKEIGGIDPINVAKLGHGVFVNGCTDLNEGDQLSPRLVRYTMDVIGGIKPKIPFHVIGSPVPADGYGGVPTMNEFFVDRGISTINVGLGVAGLHSPQELLHSGDLYTARIAYQALLEEKLGFRNELVIRSGERRSR